MHRKLELEPSQCDLQAFLFEPAISRSTTRAALLSSPAECAHDESSMIALCRWISVFVVSSL
jgi:hypothetical protein